MCLANFKLHAMTKYPLTSTGKCPILGLSTYTMLFWKLYYAVYCLIWSQNGLVVFGELFICHIQTSS